MRETIQWIVDIAKISWEIFCMEPLSCIILIAVIIIFIPVYRNACKKADKAIEPRFLR